MESKGQPGGFLNELATPSDALLSSWIKKGYSYEHLARTTVKAINPNDNFFTIRLERNKVAIPLGWFLSGTSRNELMNQAKNLDSNEQYHSFVQAAFH